MINVKLLHKKLYFIYYKGITERKETVIKDSLFKYDLKKGFGEFFWNICHLCGSASIKTTLWEDGTVDHGECLTCNRMSEIMELEESFSIETPKE